MVIKQDLIWLWQSMEEYDFVGTYQLLFYVSSHSSPFKFSLPWMSIPTVMYHVHLTMLLKMNFKDYILSTKLANCFVIIILNVVFEDWADRSKSGLRIVKQRWNTAMIYNNRIKKIIIICLLK